MYGQNLRFSFEQAYEKKTTPKWRYDLGRKKNFEQVTVFAILLFPLYFDMYFLHEKNISIKVI